MMAAEHMSRTVEELLEKMGLSSVILLARLARSWPEAVGPLLARKTFPVRLRGGVLTIRVPDHSWAQELTLAASDLVGKIGAHLGEGKVREVRFHVGPAPEAPPDDAGAGRRAEGAMVRRGASADSPLPAGLDAVADPEMREILASLSRKAAARKD